MASENEQYTSESPSIVNDSVQETMEQDTITESTESVNPETELRTVRDRNKTPKGLEWQVNQLTAEFKSRASKWRKSACSLEILIADSKDVSAIRKNRDTVSAIMRDIDAILERLNLTVTDSEGEILHGFKPILEEFQGRHEVIEGDHHSLLKQITDSIKNIQYS